MNSNIPRPLAQREPSFGIELSGIKEPVKKQSPQFGRNVDDVNLTLKSSILHVQALSNISAGMHS